MVSMRYRILKEEALLSTQEAGTVQADLGFDRMESLGLTITTHDSGDTRAVGRRVRTGSRFRLGQAGRCEVIKRSLRRPVATSGKRDQSASLMTLGASDCLLGWLT